MGARVMPREPAVRAGTGAGARVGRVACASMLSPNFSCVRGDDATCATNGATKLREPHRTDSVSERSNEPHKRQRVTFHRYRTQEVAGSSPASSTARSACYVTRRLTGRTQELRGRSTFPLCHVPPGVIRYSLRDNIAPRRSPVQVRLAPSKKSLQIVTSVGSQPSSALRQASPNFPSAWQNRRGGSELRTPQRVCVSVTGRARR